MKLFSHIQKCLNIHQLNIIKITKKDYKKARERHQSLSKEKKKKQNDNMVMKDTKISQKIKSKSWLSIEENIL